MRLWLLAAALLPAPASATQVAGSVVTSREWTVKRTPGNEQEEFSGDVRYRSGPNDIRADWALFKHATQQWQAKGRVSVKHTLASGDVVTSSGDEARFNQKTEEGSLTAKGGVDVARQPVDGLPDLAHAGRLEWSGKDRAEMSDGVHVWGPRLEAWSDRAEYDGATSELVLTGGRPVVEKFPQDPGDWQVALKGDIVTAARATGTLSASGDVRGWLVFQGSAPVPRLKR